MPDNKCLQSLFRTVQTQTIYVVCVYINDPYELMLGNAMNIPFLNTKLLTRNFFSLIEFGIPFGKHWGINQKSIQNKRNVFSIYANSSRTISSFENGSFKKVEI